MCKKCCFIVVQPLLKSIGFEFFVLFVPLHFNTFNYVSDLKSLKGKPVIKYRYLCSNLKNTIGRKLSNSSKICKGNALQ